MAIENEEDSRSATGISEITGRSKRFFREDFLSQRGRREYLMKLLILISIPILGVIIESVIRLANAITEEIASLNTRGQMNVSISLGTVSLLTSLLPHFLISC